MDERQVLLDSFVAKVKQSAALCRGDRIQKENSARPSSDCQPGNPVTFRQRQLVKVWQ